VVGAGWCVRQLAQPVQFNGAPLDRAENDKPLPFRTLTPLDKRPAHLRDIPHLRTRSIQRNECQSQKRDGKKYAAYWQDPPDQ
jgi:hypothetical protein